MRKRRFKKALKKWHFYCLKAVGGCASKKLSKLSRYERELGYKATSFIQQVEALSPLKFIQCLTTEIKESK